MNTATNQSLLELIADAQKSYQDEKNKAAFFPFWGEHELIEELEQFREKLEENFNLAGYVVTELFKDEELASFVKKNFHRLVVAEGPKEAIKDPREGFCLWNSGAINSTLICFSLVLGERNELLLCQNITRHKLAGDFSQPIAGNHYEYIDAFRLSLGLQIFTDYDRLRNYLVRRGVWAKLYRKDLGH